MNRNERQVLILSGIAVFVMFVGLPWILDRVEPRSAIERALENGDLSKLVKLAQKGHWDQSDKVAAMRAAFAIIESDQSRIQEFDAQIAPLTEVGSIVDPRVRQVVKQGLQRLNGKFIDEIATEFKERVQESVAPNAVEEPSPESVSPRTVDLTLSLWRDPSSGEILLRPGPDVTRLYKSPFVFKSFWAYEGKTRTQIEEHLASVRLLGIYIRSIRRVGAYTVSGSQYGQAPNCS